MPSCNVFPCNLLLRRKIINNGIANTWKFPDTFRLQGVSLQTFYMGVVNKDLFSCNSER